MTHSATGSRTVLVTGGSRGIGKGIALALVRAGYDLAIGHFNDTDNALAVQRLVMEQFGRQCHVIEADLSDPAQPARVVGEAVARLGHLDALVNNAGITLFASIIDVSLEDMERLIRTDFQAPLLMTQAAARHMIDNCIRGSIVNITSTRSVRAYPRDAVYGGVKAGLARATQSMALDLAPYDIRINCVAPGAIQVQEHSEFHDKLGAKIPLGRVGHPSDIGAAVRWLISDEAAYITGTTLQVDGGLILPGMPEVEKPGLSLGWGAVRDRTDTSVNP